VNPRATRESFAVDFFCRRPYAELKEVYGMKRTEVGAAKRISILVLSLVLLIYLGGYAQEEAAVTKSTLVEVVTVVDEMIGHIDWEEGYIYAVGDGVPPTDAISPAQARVRAKRAAIDTAYARLLEMAEAVRVDAESTTVNYISESYVVSTRVSGLIQNAEIVTLRHFEDGSYQVKMRMPIRGREGLASAVLPVQMEKAMRVGIAYEISIENQEILPEGESGEVYTGLIVDARGLEVQPAMYPRLITMAGEVIYDLMSANPNAVIEKGLVEYSLDMEVTENSSRVGGNPLIIDAISISGEYNADIVLTEEDAEKILSVDSINTFFGEAKVIIVVE
jgi:hypothetical protein